MTTGVVENVRSFQSRNEITAGYSKNENRTRYFFLSLSNSVIHALPSQISSSNTELHEAEGSQDHFCTLQYITLLVKKITVLIQ